MIYTPEILISQLRAEGVILEKREGGKLFIDGELSTVRLEAVKKLKPQILDILDAPVIYRFGANEYLFDDLEKSLQIFSSENESANRFIRYLVNHGEQQAENGLPGVMFKFPTLNAYKSDLRIADAVLMHERGRITANEFKNISQEYVRTHTSNGQLLTEWMQDADAPLYQIYIHADGKRIAESIGNTIQTAITSVFWSAADARARAEIAKA